MIRKVMWGFACAAALLLAEVPRGSAGRPESAPIFQSSDRCVACHNGITTAAGQDVSIGLAWRTSIMANSSRDPYWQASVRRESLDYPEARAEIEDECSTCHMPMPRFAARMQGRKGEVFAHLPFDAKKPDNNLAEDGVSCSVCHQITGDKLGSPESFNGGFSIAMPKPGEQRPEYGPFAIESGQQRIMHTSTSGFQPTEAAHIRDSAMCATCHTLYTTVLAPGGKDLGKFPEQMPYLEWLHSDYPKRSSCQSCHMPPVPAETPIAAVLGQPRSGAREHTFVAANFFMQRMLNLFRHDLSTQATPEEMSAAAEKTIAFLQSESARLTIPRLDAQPGTLQFDVVVENLTGHKLPTAYPSRRAWLHVVVTDRDGKNIFESGALNPDGSIRGNPNDVDPARYQPHLRDITRADQVQIYEPILKDTHGRVTTGLLSAVGYLKDNRLLPTGFAKETAGNDIAVVGEARDDPDFGAGRDTVHYAVPLSGAGGPFRVEVELWYQPIGFRWANNLRPYNAAEPRRFVGYYDAMAANTAVVLTRVMSDSRSGAAVTRNDFRPPAWVFSP